MASRIIQVPVSRRDVLQEGRRLCELSSGSERGYQQWCLYCDHHGFVRRTECRTLWHEMVEALEESDDNGELENITEDTVSAPSVHGVRQKYTPQTHVPKLQCIM